MDVWWNNHFLCNDLESSNWNNHKKLVVWSSRYLIFFPPRTSKQWSHFADVGSHVLSDVQPSRFLSPRWWCEYHAGHGFNPPQKNNTWPLIGCKKIISNDWNIWTWFLLNNIIPELNHEHLQYVCEAQAPSCSNLPGVGRCRTTCVCGTWELWWLGACRLLAKAWSTLGGLNFFLVDTPAKTNMEPKHGGLEDDFPFQRDDFHVPS